MQSDTTATEKMDEHSNKPTVEDWLELIGPIASVDSLPPPGIKRWVIRRKAEVVAAVRAGILSIDEACERYTLSVEEFLSWQRSIDRHGLRGLRTTRIQDYRASDQTLRGSNDD